MNSPAIARSPNPAVMAAPAASSAAGSSKAAVSRGTRKNGSSWTSSTNAVDVLLAINDDATHLFGYSGVRKDGMNANMLTRLNDFAAHVNDLLTPPGGEAFIPGHGDSQAPWELTTRQFRRSLAWHIAHQPFGIVAGARQYKHAQVTIFEGYAGTSASGFAAEVEAEQAVARP